VPLPAAKITAFIAPSVRCKASKFKSFLRENTPPLLPLGPLSRKIPAMQ